MLQSVNKVFIETNIARTVNNNGCLIISLPYDNNNNNIIETENKGVQTIIYSMFVAALYKF